MSQIITVSELQAAIDTPGQLIVVDTLPDTAFAKGHLPGAINIRSDDIIDAAPERLPDKDTEIVVYCASPRCQRAGKAAARLERLGYTRVRHFEGGKEDWRAAGLPLVTD
jgi:rhodanese-related sulfurtransferase